VGLVFDTLGDREETEAVTQADDCGGDLSALPCVRHGSDEAGVYFELVKGEGLKVTEAGVTSPEVVEGEERALLLQLVGNEIGELRVSDEGALCDLEDEPIKGEVVQLGCSTDVAGERAIGQLGEGDVDGEGEVFGQDRGRGKGCTE
jgi:hypothetical protein